MTTQPRLVIRYDPNVTTTKEKEHMTAVDQLDLPQPISPPRHQSHEYRHEGDAPGDAPGDARRGRGIGVPFDSEKARAAAEKRWGSASSLSTPPDSPDAQVSEAEALRLMMKVQYNVATGRTKGTTATQQTQAAKAWAELRETLQGLEEEEKATRYDLASLTDRYDLLEYAVTLDEEGMARMRAWIAREEPGQPATLTNMERVEQSVRAADDPSYDGD